MGRPNGQREYWSGGVAYGGEGARTPEKMDSPNKIGMFLVTPIHVFILIFYDC